MSNETKDSLMVLCDVTDVELNLIDFLVEKEMSRITEENLDGVMENELELWTYDELEELWSKIQKTQIRMDRKLAERGIATAAFKEKEDIIEVEEYKWVDDGGRSEMP